MRKAGRRDVGKKYTARTILACLAAMSATALAAEKLNFEPGWNIFSHDQDIQFGKQSVAEVEKQLPLVTDPEVNRYVSTLGRRVAGFAPGNTDYPWTFKVVNSQDINAFALPGGFIYVNRGVLEAADDEAQVAGVMAHEIGHVVMRHGTHNATLTLAPRLGLGILGGLLGDSGGLASQAVQLIAEVGVTAMFLKNSRGAESQADEVGTYILYHGGYNPHAMAQFFEIIATKYPQQTLDFFSDHPNPENRIKKVDALIPQLGPPQKGTFDSPEFQATKKRVLALPPPPKAKPAGGQPAPKAPPPPPAPSSNFVKYRGQAFAISYPDNWQAQEDNGGVTLTPPGGIITDAQGGSAQAYGAMVNLHTPSKKGWGLVDATQELIESLRQSNPNLRVVKQTSMKIRGQAALSTRLENDSPLEGQKETDQLVTVRGRNALTVVLFVVPQTTFESYQPTFNAMLQSLELR